MNGFGEIAEKLRRSTVQIRPHGRDHGGGDTRKVRETVARVRGRMEAAA